MKSYRLFFEPDKAVPQFKRLRFEEMEVPLRDVLSLRSWQGAAIVARADRVAWAWAAMPGGGGRGRRGTEDPSASALPRGRWGRGFT